MDDLGSFIRQVPITILLAPVIFGALYIGLTAYILRRAAKRRRREREAKEQMRQQVIGPKKMPLGDFLSGELPEKPLKSADWTVPPELRALPEPDLDILANPVLLDVMPPLTDPQAIPQAPAVSAMAVEPDWIAAVVPPQETPNTETIIKTAEMTNTEMTNTANTENSMDSRLEGDISGNAVEVMRVWRDLSDGTLIIQMGNQRYRSLSDIKNPDLARRFMAVVRELWAMVNNAPMRATGLQPNVTNGSPASQPVPGTPPGGMKARIGLLNTEVEQPLPNMFKQMTRDLNQKASTAPEPPSGIANAVEDFLQFKLSSTPQFAARSIHIRPSHNHGVMIEVDGHFYDSIGDVIDPDVREFLFALMREWEARH